MKNESLLKPEQAAEIARDAKVRYLLLNHIAPPLPMPGRPAQRRLDPCARHQLR